MVSVLLVDDDPQILDSTKLFLEAYDFHVTLARNGIEAMDMIQKQDFDLAIVDLFMPYSGGIETISKICRRMPIIAVSGQMKDRLSEEEISRSLNVDHFFAKPFDPRKLVHAINELVH
ncbi:response regulator [Terasakiella sp. SH-1]|uniref:response regulator n=1 Tax=Terasakiella sp. SH-1 TaxID=2560057 RepID=UPI001073BC02|nr:response regulator [Terasakiella sp. SH-1]